MFDGFRPKSRYRMPVTPMDPDALLHVQNKANAAGRADAGAAVTAWKEPGDNPEWHYLMQDEFRRAMPVVAHFLDVAAYGIPDNRPRREP